MTSPRARQLPPWFRTSLSTSGRFVAVRNRLREGSLRTVCEGAACPNRNECWNAGTATFLILGDRCTRSCRFCNIPSGHPIPVDRKEAQRVAQAAKSLCLDHVVITSVTRDDLPDGGAGLFAETIHAVRSIMPACTIEVLVPDFQGSREALDTVLAAAPDILNHNIETVPSLYPSVRPQADFRRSLGVLAQAVQRGCTAKSGMMAGLGEDREKIHETMQELRKTGCELLTIGQYLQPRRDLWPVARFYHPDEFRDMEQEGVVLGFTAVQAGPLVRSSYHAATMNHHRHLQRMS
ncbi:MAG: lipoyl synthase [Nitrospiraceae bacterium]|nr:lipoyl synthase [Nitrospiraceae bacterium]